MSGRQDQSRQAPATARNAWAFWVSAYTLFVLLVGTNLPTPLYRGYEQLFGHSTLVTTLIFAVYVAALVPSLLIAGPLSDAIGRGAVIAPSIVVAMAGALGLLFAGGTEWLFGARILQGISIGAASGALTASIVETEPSGDRGRAALATTAVSLGGLGAGPLLAGLLAQYAPGPFTTSYALEAGLLLVALVLVAFLPGTTRRTHWRPRRPSIPVGMEQVFAVGGSANFLAFSVIGLFLSLVPGYVLSLSGSTNLAVAGGAAALMLACSVAAQIAGHGRAAIRLQASGLALLAAGLLLLVLAGWTASLWLLLVASVVAGFGHGRTFLGGMSEINRLAPPARQAETISAFYVIVYLGVRLPVIGAGLLAKVVGSLAAVQIFAAILVPLLLTALGLLAFGHRRLDRDSARAPGGGSAG